VAPGQPPVEAEKEATPEEFGNKFGNISEEEQEEASQVVDIVARPEGFEPPTLRSEEACDRFYPVLRDNVRLISLGFAPFVHLPKLHIS
jgi:hypothetical protein